MRIFKPNIAKLEQARDIDGLVRALDDPEAPIRAAAIRALGQSGDRRAAGPLYAVVRGKDAGAAQLAADALGQISDPGAVDILCDALRGGPPPLSRAAAAALGRIGDPRAVEPLLARLTELAHRLRPGEGPGEDRVPPCPPTEFFPGLSLLQAIAEALGRIRDERAIDSLCGLLQLPYADVIRAAATALGEIGSERSAEPLCDILRRDNAGVRKAAADALVRIGAPARLPLGRLLQEGDRPSRQAAVDTFRQIGPPEPPDLLAWFAVAASDWPLAVSLGADALAPFAAALRDDDPEIRRAAAGALGETGLERAVQVLCAALRDHMPAVARAAGASLKRLGAPAVEPLCGMLEDDSRLARETAARTLGEIGDAAAVAPLGLLVWDDAASVRAAAARALGQIGDPQGVDPLLAALQDREVEVCRAAAEALGHLGDTRAVEPLLAMLRSRMDDSLTVEPVVRGLRGIPDHRILGPLVETLKKHSDSEEICGAVVDAFVALKDNNVCRVLVDWATQRRTIRVSEYIRWPTGVLRVLASTLETKPTLFSNDVLVKAATLPDTTVRFRVQADRDGDPEQLSQETEVISNAEIRRLAALELSRRNDYSMPP